MGGCEVETFHASISLLILLFWKKGDAGNRLDKRKNNFLIEAASMLQFHAARPFHKAVFFEKKP